MKTKTTNNITRTELKSGKISWGFYLLIGGKDAVTGKRKQITERGFKTEREAKAALQEAIRKSDATLASGDSRTFARWFEDWITGHASKRCQPKTIERYRELGAYAIRHFGNVSLADLKPITLHDAYDKLLASGKRDGSPLSARTVRHIGFTVHDALQCAFQLELIATNPMKRVKLPKAPKKRVTILDHDRLKTFLVSVRENHLYAFVLLAAATGCRRGELLALTWPDIDFETGVMNVSKSLEETRAGLRVKGTKSDEPRRFVIPQIALTALREHQADQSRHRQMFGSGYNERELVFSKPDGDYWFPDYITKRITILLRKAGFAKGVTLHTLRHSHASELLSKKVPLPVVSKRLGHASPAITLAIYSHALEADELEAAKTWNTAMADLDLELSREKAS